MIDSISNKWQMTPPLLALICLTGFIVSLVINYPGFMSPDSVQQILEARAGVYSDWHPPFMAFIWHFTDKIVPGPAGMLLLETALIWSGTFLIALSYFNNPHFPLYALAPCALPFFPPVFGISGAVWKDILMWGFLLLAIGVTGTFTPIGLPSHSRGVPKLVIAASFLLAATLCRHNAVFAVIPLIALGAARSIGPAPSHRRIATASFIGALAFAAILFLAAVINAALTTYKPALWADLALFDIAGIILHLPPEQQQALYDRVPAHVRGNGSLDNLLRTYRSYSSDTLLDPENPAFSPELWPWSHHVVRMGDIDITPQDQAALKHLWGDAILHHPIAWLIHRVSVFRQVIGSPYSDGSSVMMEPNDSPEWLANAYGHSPERTKLQNYIRWWLTNLVRHRFFKPWIYLGITMVVMLVCFLPSFTMERAQIGLIAASGFVNEAGLFLVAPSASFRYSHYMIYTSLLASLLLIQTLFSRATSSTTAQSEMV
jgi:hypothetical protein